MNNTLRRVRVIKGGPGSGFFGHRGRVGKIGGSTSRAAQEAIHGGYGVIRYGPREEEIEPTASMYAGEYQDVLKDIKSNPDIIAKGRRTSWNDAMDTVDRIVTKSSSDEAPDDNVKDMYADWLTYHDKNVVSHLNSIVVPDNLAEWRGEYKRRYGINPVGYGVGFYNPEKHQLVIKPRSVSAMADVLHHEIGHVAQINSKSKNIWTNAWNNNKNFGRHTTYSKVSSDEGFAEGYMSYVKFGLSDIKLAEYQDTYAIIQEVIDGIP